MKNTLMTQHFRTLTKGQGHVRTAVLAMAVLIGSFFAVVQAAVAQFPRKGTVEVGGRIGFRLDVQHGEKILRVTSSPKGIVDARLDPDYGMVRVHGLREGSARIIVDKACGIVGPCSAREETLEVTVTKAAVLSARSLKTVRDYFMILPEEYFLLEGCEWEVDQDCRQARRDYLKRFAAVEDTQNGYLKGNCDGAQACMEMALFKRPDSTHLVGLHRYNSHAGDSYFLDYKNGRWTDVSTQVVPRFSRKNVYELPRFGTTVSVYSTKVTSRGKNWETREKGRKLYDLEWKNGRFEIAAQSPGKVSVIKKGIMIGHIPARRNEAVEASRILEGKGLRVTLAEYPSDSRTGGIELRNYPTGSKAEADKIAVNLKSILGNVTATEDLYQPAMVGVDYSLGLWADKAPPSDESPRKVTVVGSCKHAVEPGYKYVSYGLTFDILYVISGRFSSNDVRFQIERNSDHGHILEALKVGQMDGGQPCDPNMTVTMTFGVAGERAPLLESIQTGIAK